MSFLLPIPFFKKSGKKLLQEQQRQQEEIKRRAEQLRRERQQNKTRRGAATAAEIPVSTTTTTATVTTTTTTTATRAAELAEAERVEAERVKATEKVEEIQIEAKAKDAEPEAFETMADASAFGCWWCGKLNGSLNVLQYVAVWCLDFILLRSRRISQVHHWIHLDTKAEQLSWALKLCYAMPLMEVKTIHCHLPVQLRRRLNACAPW